ncbi:hypothetical protein D3C85_1368190 [compost metagenome]
MQGAGHQLFTGSRFALDQHIGVCWGDLADLAVQVLHRWAGADDADLAIGRIAGRGLVATCRLAVAPFSGRGGRVLPVAQDAGHGLQHFVVVERLGDVVHRTHFHRVDGRTQARVAGHDQHRRALAELDQFGARRAR